MLAHRYKMAGIWESIRKPLDKRDLPLPGFKSAGGEHHVTSAAEVRPTVRDNTCNNNLWEQLPVICLRNSTLCLWARCWTGLNMGRLASTTRRCRLRVCGPSSSSSIDSHSTAVRAVSPPATCVLYPQIHWNTLELASCIRKYIVHTCEREYGVRVHDLHVVFDTRLVNYHDCLLHIPWFVPGQRRLWTLHTGLRLHTHTHIHHTHTTNPKRSVCVQLASISLNLRISMSKPRP